MEKLNYTSAAYQDIGRDVASMAGERAPAVVDAFLKRYGPQMTDDARSAVMTEARVQEDHARAIREHQAAVQQHQEEVARSEARARLESVQRMISDGVNVPPQMLSDAQNDARTAKDPGLTESLRQGGLKNNLTVRWANATPAQLTDRVNALSAQITQAGGNVHPDVMVERDHLQKLADNSSSELRSDGISWGGKAPWPPGSTVGLQGSPQHCGPHGGGRSDQPRDPRQCLAPHRNRGGRIWQDVWGKTTAKRNEKSS